MLALLRRRNVALLWWGGVLSVTGDWVLLTALPYDVYQRTGSTLATAALTVVAIAPAIVLGTVAGVLVDRWDRQRIMIVTNLLQTVSVLGLVAVPLYGWLWPVYAVALVQAALSCFTSPAESALLPCLVEEDLLLSANALTGLSSNVARLVGPPIGGALLALWGLSAVVICDSLSFLMAGVLVALISPDAPRTREAHRPQTHQEISTLAQRWTAF